MPMPSLTPAALIFALALLPVAAAKAAELRVIAGGSITLLLNELGPQFEQASGHKLSIHFDSTPNIIARVNSGTPFDLAIVPVDAFKDAAAKAHFVEGPTVDIARVGYGRRLDEARRASRRPRAGSCAGCDRVDAAASRPGKDHLHRRE